MVKYMLHVKFLQVLEETGFDVSEFINQEIFLENKLNDQLTRLYIIENVPLDTKFQPKTRKEIKVCMLENTSLIFYYTSYY